MPDKQWQFIGDDSWNYGPLVRGVVRPVEAAVYFDEDSDSRDGGWVWFVLGALPITPPIPHYARGHAGSLQAAVAAAEAAMGIPPA